MSRGGLVCQEASEGTPAQGQPVQGVGAAEADTSGWRVLSWAARLMGSSRRNRILSQGAELVYVQEACSQQARGGRPASVSSLSGHCMQVPRRSLHCVQPTRDRSPRVPSPDRLLLGPQLSPGEAGDAAGALVHLS